MDDVFLSLYKPSIDMVLFCSFLAWPFICWYCVGTLNCCSLNKMYFYFSVHRTLENNFIIQYQNDIIFYSHQLYFYTKLHNDNFNVHQIKMFIRQRLCLSVTTGCLYNCSHQLYIVVSPTIGCVKQNIFMYQFCVNNSVCYYYITILFLNRHPTPYYCMYTSVRLANLLP